MVITWLFWSFWILTDVLAICLAITALTFVRLPNLKVATVLLSLFFLYDIFWVFLSEYIFKKNVMVSVATKMPSLPMVVLLKRLDGGFSLLGVGDIVLPGLLLCYLYRFDYFNRKTFLSGYFFKAWIGYALGMICTLLMVAVLNRAQPALLYLVPGTLLPTFFFSKKNNEFHLLWKGLMVVSMQDEDDIDLEAQNLNQSEN